MQKSPFSCARKVNREVPSWICVWGAVVHFDPHLNQFSAVIFPAYFSRNILAKKAEEASLRKVQLLVRQAHQLTLARPLKGCQLITTVRARKSHLSGFDKIASFIAPTGPSCSNELLRVTTLQYCSSGLSWTSFILYLIISYKEQLITFTNSTSSLVFTGFCYRPHSYLFLRITNPHPALMWKSFPDFYHLCLLYSFYRSGKVQK